MPPEAATDTGEQGAPGQEISHHILQHSLSDSPSSSDDEGVSLATASRRPAPEPAHAPPPKLRSALSHKNHHPNPGRHVVKAHIGGRTTSFGKNLNKLTVQQQQHAAMPPGGNTSTPQRPQPQRSQSHTLSSSSATSPRLALGVRRNASGFVVSRGTTHSALKKNLSSGHLTKHGSSKNMVKSGRPSAPPMKRTQSAKSNTSQKSQKSPVEPQHHPTVRFNLAAERAPGDDTDDNEWTEDSTSISPATTRDHTRQNSVILNSTLHAAAVHAAASSTATPGVQADVSRQDSQTEGQPAEPTSIRRNASNHSILTPDAITSRLLMRTPSMNNTALSHISATAVGTPSQSNLSHSPGSTLHEGSASGSGGRDLVSRFLAGGNSHGTTRDMLGQTVLDRNLSRQGSVDQGSDSENPSRPLDTHRRNKSTPNVAASKTSRNNTPSSVRLPPSRTSQKLELQRASTLVEPARKVPVAPSRPTAPLLLSSGMNSFGFGHGEGGSVPAQLQGLFAQIDKEYAVVRRFRRPVQDAISRLERKHGSIEAVAKGKGRLSQSTADGRRAGPAQSGASKQPSLELRYSKPHSRDGASQQSGAELTAPEHLNQRRSRVSFELPDNNRRHEDDLDTAAHHRAVDPERDEALEICRRMWDLSNVVDIEA